MIYSSLRAATTGEAKGRIALLSSPLSLWGGLDLADGTICDVSHPQHGLSIKDKVIAMRAGRGSSSSSSVLVEATRRGIGPKAIILSRIDPILVIGSLVATELYGISIPIVLFPDDLWYSIPANAEVEIIATGETATLKIRRRST
jgi:predicted aconitase with swiveling domain